MNHLAYYNNVVSLNNLFYDSHKMLVEKVCKELNADDKVDELVKKLLDKPDMKPKRDPNRPKRPKSAFLLFCDDERPKLIEKQKKSLKGDEKFNLGVVQKKLGEAWGKLAKEKKEKYETLSEKGKESYFDELSEYESTLE